MMQEKDMKLVSDPVGISDPVGKTVLPFAEKLCREGGGGGEMADTGFTCSM